MQKNTTSAVSSSRSPRYLSQGSYGCTFDHPIPCSINHLKKLRKNPRDYVAKVMSTEAFKSELHYAQVIRNSIDPAAQFTPRMFGACNVAAPEQTIQSVEWAKCRGTARCKQGDCSQIIYGNGGKELSDMSPPVTLPEFLDFLVQYAKGLKRFARHGYIHGDIKQDNVLALRYTDKSTGRPRIRCNIIDYGLMATHRRYGDRIRRYCADPSQPRMAASYLAPDYETLPFALLAQSPQDPRKLATAEAQLLEDLKKRYADIDAVTGLGGMVHLRKVYEMASTQGPSLRALTEKDLDKELREDIGKILGEAYDVWMFGRTMAHWVRYLPEITKHAGYDVKRMRGIILLATVVDPFFRTDWDPIIGQLKKYRDDIVIKPRKSVARPKMFARKSVARPKMFAHKSVAY